ncbi:glycosyltransferase [Actinoallomurus iriomotensis]|uniref:Glycosyl transferase n=1 Tax=Actinoallomurus iriomotensis TaxID=478107 RepID=A0A9W6RV45_9ACTN|nr:glycosyltransferase [Actinoallomurus iriomotensis]GLY80712.1 glycosyl transferase [Actinoallomurus iriomotensis]
MRIALVSEHASPLAVLGEADAGGQNVHVAALADHLCRRGHEVTVHTRRDDPGLPDRVVVDAGYTVEHVPAGPPEPVPKDLLLPHMREFGQELGRRWRARPPDVAHAHFWMSGLASLAASEGAVPVALTYHALGTVKRRHLGEDDPSPAGRLDVERRIGQDADHIIATCSDEVFELAAMGVTHRRTTIVPCGVDLARLRPDGPADDRVPRRERHRLIYVGRLVERKGVETAVRALVDLPDAELVVAGGPAASELDGDREACRLRKVAAEVGVADRLVMLGGVPPADVPALLRSADVAVFTPWYEPFGIAPVEAMACGVPVVASAVGGIVDTVAGGVTGEHVPPRRPDVLAATLRALLDDPERLAAYGRAGAGRARSRYSWEHVAARTETVYDRLARRRPMAASQ